MNDLFHALYQRYANFRGAADAYTLTGGRMYRGQAPEGVIPQNGAYIIMTLIGGVIDWMFGADKPRLEAARVQLDVYAEWTGSSIVAMNVWNSLVKLIEDEPLQFLDGTLIRVRREGLPREIVDGRVIQISGDWVLEQQF